MKTIVHCFALLLFLSFTFIETNAQTAYSMHTIATGETLSALAKNYHTTVGDIMRMNGMNSNSQLHIGDKIKIPAAGTVVAEKPVIAASAPVAASTKIAKTHVVEKGETLYRLSKMYNISVAKLIQLNKLSVPTTHVGQTIIISEGTAPQTPGQTKEKTPAPQQEIKKQTTQNTTVSTPASTTETSVKNTTPETKMQQNKNAISAPVEAQTTAVSAVDNNAIATTNTDVLASNAAAPKEGFFTTMYGKDVQQKMEQNKSGTAMTFKSASGWSDKKYYILMNDAPTGSIVKISNGKTELYAKVLWSLSAMKENEGLQFRISTAAAAALGITDQKFDLKVSYYE